MHSSILPTLSFLVLGALAIPAPSATPVSHGGDPLPAGSCMTRAEALLVAQNFKDLQDKVFNITLARQAVSPDFIDYNDSINILIDQGCPLEIPIPLGAPTFATRADYFAAAKNQNPTPYETLKVWNTCDTVIARWRAHDPYEGVTGVEPQMDVTGIVVIEVTPSQHPSAAVRAAQPWQFATIYSEFNSFSWGYDLGLWKSDLCDASGAPLPQNTTSKRSARPMGLRL